MDSSTQTLPRPAPRGDTASARATLEPRDAEYLKEIGLLRQAPGGFYRISPDIMLETKYSQNYDKSKDRNMCTRNDVPFRFWHQLSPELRVMTMEQCKDVEVLSLAQTSKDTRELGKDVVRRRREGFARIPAANCGLATLQYLGYTEWKAAELWAAWGALESLVEAEDVNSAFLAHCLSPLWSIRGEADDHGNTDAFDDRDDWRAVMSHWGVSMESQDAILDPEFCDIRLTESAAYWVCKTFELRWSTLRHIQNASWLRAYPRKTLKARPSVLQHHQENGGDTTFLYKPIDIWTAYRLFRPGQKPLLSLLPVLEDGEEEWTVDFSCWETPLIFYPSRFLAEKFARYSTLRSYGHSSAALVKMSIPTKTLREKLKLKNFGEGEEGEEEWKKVVWMNRMEEDPMIDAANGISNPVVDMWGLELVVGKVSCNKGKAVKKMASWAEMSGDNVLMVDGGGGLEAAVQYSFLGEECVLELENNVSLEMLEL
jgi:hypothetical protein